MQFPPVRNDPISCGPVSRIHRQSELRRTGPISFLTQPRPRLALRAQPERSRQAGARLHGTTNTMCKILGVTLIALVAAACTALGIYLTQFEPAIQSAVENEGGLATQTSVLVGSVQFSPFTGAGTLDGLTVGNPHKFSSPYAVVVNRIALQVERSSLFGSGPIVVEAATVIAPQITYQAQNPTATSNLETIKQNAQFYSGTPAAIRAGNSMRKVIIRDLTIMGGSISLNIPLSADRLTVPLPPLYLSNIGVTTDGSTLPEIIRAVSEELVDAAKQVVAQAIVQKIKSVVERLPPPQRALPKLPAPPFPQLSLPPALSSAKPMLPPPDLSGKKPVPSPPELPINRLPDLPEPPRIKLPPPPPGILPFPTPPGF